MHHAASSLDASEAQIRALDPIANTHEALPGSPKDLAHHSGQS